MIKHTLTEKEIEKKYLLDSEVFGGHVVGQEFDGIRVFYPDGYSCYMNEYNGFDTSVHPNVQKAKKFYISSNSRINGFGEIYSDPNAEEFIFPGAKVYLEVKDNFIIMVFGNPSSLTDKQLRELLAKEAEENDNLQDVVPIVSGNVGSGKSETTSNIISELN